MDVSHLSLPLHIPNLLWALQQRTAVGLSSSRSHVNLYINVFLYLDMSTGKPNVTEDQVICFTCHDDLVQYEPHLQYYHSQHCNHFDQIGPQMCDPGEVNA